jgi:hypothetical protein
MADRYDLQIRADDQDVDRIKAMVATQPAKRPTREEVMRLIASNPRLQVAVAHARANHCTLDDIELLSGFGIIEVTAAQRIG